MFDRISTDAGRIRLHLRGALDGEASLGVRQGLERVAAAGQGDVVLDFADVTQIDGSGIGAVSFLFRRLAARGRRLTLEGVSGQPLAMLHELGLRALFDLPEEPRRRPFLAAAIPAWSR